MTDIIPTVVIRKANKWGYAIINECDFDPKKHTLLGDGEAPQPAPVPPEVYIPADYADLPAKTRIAIAKAISGGAVKNAAEADAIVAEHTKAQQAPEQILLGSSRAPAVVEVGAVKIQLGGLVIASFRESGLIEAAWNDLAEADREERLSHTHARFSEDLAALAAEVSASSILEVPDGGLADAEINADLEALKVEFDPKADRMVRLVQRFVARAARDAEKA